MSISAVALQRLQQRAAQADQLIAYLKAQLASIRKSTASSACQLEEAKLRSENAAIKEEISKLRDQLVAVEICNGLRQVPLPKNVPLQIVSPTPATQTAAQPPKDKPATSTDNKAQQPKKDKKPKKGEPKEAKAPQEAAPIDVSRLNMIVGHIVTAKKHPDADGLYVEEVNLGEGRNRTIVSGLVKFVPLEQMQNRLAIFLTNLKPAKMRGILSEGMIMCGSSPEVVEIINPPEGAVIGDRISVEGYPGEPDSLLNPKKKIWEQIQPDLRISADGVATYKGIAWQIGDKGICKVPTMRDTIIK